MPGGPTRLGKSVASVRKNRLLLLLYRASPPDTGAARQPTGGENHSKENQKACQRGSIYKRKDGRWAAEWTAQTLNGQRRRTVYGKTQAEVVR